MKFKPDNYRKLLSVADNHRLLLADARVRVAQSVERQSYLLRELDTNQKLVAHYRVWTHRSGIPPFKEQNGWEKYAPDGRLLDREVRYTELPAGTRLH